VYILAFDTTTSGISIALNKNGDNLCIYNNSQQANHCQQLIVEIENILNQNNIWYQDLDLITVTNGPGSFTGSRIGLTVAKTIKLSTNAPLILLNCCEVIAYQNWHKLNNNLTKMLVVLDARAQEIFYCYYDYSESLILNQNEPKIINITDIEQIIISQQILLSGSATSIVGEHLVKKNITNFIATQDNADINAIDIAKLALEKFNSEIKSTNLNPIYLRQPNITKKKTG